MPKHMGALTFTVTPEIWERAVKSKSGGCLVAEAIKEQYPHLERVRVNVAVIRATDTRAGERVLWSSPPAVGMILLHLDQGWAQPATRRVQTKPPIQITPVTLSRARNAERGARLAELEAKDPATLTRVEKVSLTKLRKRPKPRPVSEGRMRAVSRGGNETIHGGRQKALQEARDTMLGGADRHYGQKLAKGGVVWDNAVAAAAADEIERRRAAGEL